MPDAGGIYLLTQLIGGCQATELVMLGEQLTAAKAQDLGLINAVVSVDELDAAVAKLTDRLTSLPSLALAAMKQSINQVAYAGLDIALDQEVIYQMQMALTEDFKEGKDRLCKNALPSLRVVNCRMCIVAIAWQLFDAMPLVLLSNRDEFVHRPTRALQHGSCQMGKKLWQGKMSKGGTWLGINPNNGRWGVALNYREIVKDKPNFVTSRGELIIDYGW